MAKKKSEMKQISKQQVIVNIGKAVRRRRARPRKRASASKGSSVLQGGFVAPIINYPPNYVNPAVVQPLQQPQSFLVPKPVAARTARAPTVFNEGENILGLPTTDPTKLKLPLGEASLEVPSFVEPAPKTVKVSKKKQKPGENELGGLDANLGSAYEPLVSTGDVFENEGEASSPLSSADFKARRGPYKSEEEKRLLAEERKASKKRAKALAGRFPEGEALSPSQAYEEGKPSGGFSFVGYEEPAEPPPLSGLERDRE